jgi:hypothetical protein
MVQPAGSKLGFPEYPLNTLQRNLPRSRPFSLISLVRPLAPYASLLGKVALICAQNHRLFPFFKELASQYQSVETLRRNDYNAYIESVRKAFPREVLTTIFSYATKQAKDFLVEETKEISSTQNNKNLVTSTKSFRSMVDAINTREVPLSDFNFTFEELKNFMSFSPDLKYVDLRAYNSMLIDDDFMDHLLKHCRGIQTLLLPNSTPITDKTILKITSLSEIIELDLASCEHITLMQNDIPIAFPSTLSILVLKGCTKVTDTSLAKLPPSLQKLDLSYTGVRDLTLPAGLEWLNLSNSKFICHDNTVFPPGLVSLNLNFCEVKGAPLGLKTLSDNLKELTLAGTEINENGLLSLPKKLQSLNIVACRSLTGSCIPSLPKNLTTLVMPKISLSGDLEPFPKSIQSLYLFVSSISDAGINRLPTQLQELSICGTQPINFNLRTNLSQSLTSLILTGITFDDQSLNYLPSSLQKLDIPGTFITNEGIELIPPLKNLRITDCRNITNEGMNFPEELESLVLSDAIQVTDEGLLKLPPHLKELRLDGFGSITGRSFKSFSRNIKTITLKDAVLELKYISDLPRGLMELSLTCKLNDKALSDLPPDLKTLQLLRIGNDVTLNGLKRLSKKLTSLWIDSCSVFRNEWLEALPSNLVQLILSNTSVNENRLEILNDSRFQNLKNVTIVKTPNVLAL